MIPTHRIMPHYFFDEDSSKLGCTEFYIECRRAVAHGAEPDKILGDAVLDVSGLVNGDSLKDSSRLSKWAIMFTMNFGDCAWQLQLAFAYFAFHLMRVCLGS